jgi:hypothetical protein
VNGQVKTLVVAVTVSVMVAGGWGVAFATQSGDGATDGPVGCAPVLADGTFPTGPELADWVRHGYPSQIYRVHEGGVGYYNVFTVPEGVRPSRSDEAREKTAPFMESAVRDSSPEALATCYLPPVDTANGFYNR